MKIAVVYQHYYPEEFRITPICEELVKRGHEVTVYTGLPNYPHGNVPKKYRCFKNRHEVHNGVNIIRSFEIGRKKGKLGLALNYVSYMISSVWRSLFVKCDFDIIFAYSTSPILMSLPALTLKRRSNKKIHMYLMDIWPACLAAMNVKKTSLLYRFMGRVSKFVYSNCDTISYSSKSFKKYMKDVHDIELQDKYYLPQFADEIFEGEPTKLNENCFVFAGNIGHMQSVDTIVKAADILRDKPIKWIILGDGSEFENIKALVNKLKLQDKIQLPGRRPLEEMPKYYSMASAMLLTMRDDELVSYTVPAKLQGYYAFAKPVIAAINGESRDTIEESGGGIAVQADDPKALAGAIERFISLSEIDKLKMAQNAKAYYKQNYIFKDYMDELEKQFKELL